MSNEITVNVQLRAKNGNLDFLFAPGTLLFNQSSQVGCGGIQVIGTATNAELLAVGDVTTAGWTVYRNLDTTNYIDVGTGTGTSFVASLRLLAGECAIAPIHPTNVPSARANSAACNLQYFILSR